MRDGGRANRDQWPARSPRGGAAGGGAAIRPAAEPAAGPGAGRRGAGLQTVTIPAFLIIGAGRTLTPWAPHGVGGANHDSPEGAAGDREER
ncbi:hypothetical protein GCM10022214_79720 [Actinomadura miaoliensis]|uniref:Uncharacterized protein n=1 Tax=Actinomadura miaoliensis TaxID=430685 RepID=A0ABP7X261_9ACTN